MWEARHALTSTATPTAVWALWTDAERWSDWNPDIAHAEFEGPFKRGTAARIKFMRSGTLRFTITALEHERIFTDGARLPGARMGRASHRAHRGRNRDQQPVFIYGPAERLYTLALDRRMRRSIRGFVGKERSLAEAAGSDAPRS